MATERSNKFSERFNSLSVAVAFALTGLIVFYLPDIVQRPFSWKIEGHLIGLTLAVLGAFAILMSARKLTNRDSFLSWAMAVLAGSIASALLAITRNLSLPRWLAVALLIVSVTLIIVAIYALVLGFSQLFDANLAVRVWPRRSSNKNSARHESEPSPPASTNEPRKLNWYEWITLIVATVAAVATVVATAASFIPASPS